MVGNECNNLELELPPGDILHVVIQHAHISRFDHNRHSALGLLGADDESSAYPGITRTVPEGQRVLRVLPHVPVAHYHVQAWQRRVLANVLRNRDIEVLLVENGHQIVHVGDDDRHDRRGGFGWDLVIDQLRRLHLERVDTAILQDSGILPVEGNVRGDKFPHCRIALSRHVEIEMARVLVFQRQQQASWLTRVAVPRSHRKDRVAGSRVLRKCRAIRRVQEHGRLILKIIHLSRTCL